MSITDSTAVASFETDAIQSLTNGAINESLILPSAQLVCVLAGRTGLLLTLCRHTNKVVTP
ncbi:hypothetical protein ACO0K7_03275 [Undibacterium sp. Ji67W]|uniref:hypothetical protein n=1 Tax=Undibacterium sp. Ji67W TaxID=3413042 RepID=UPI003BF42897